MQSKVQINKNLIGLFKSFTYSCNIQLDEKSFESVFRICCEIVEKLKSESRLLKNIKGADKFNFVEEIKFDQQLFGYTVSYINDRKLEEQVDYHILTPFDSFSSSSIFHKFESVSNAELQTDSPLTNPELTLKSFQLGMDFYGMTSFGNWFLKTPVVTESFFLKADSRSELGIYFTSDNRPESFNLPAPLRELFSKIQDLLNHNIFADLQSKLRGL